MSARHDGRQDDLGARARGEAHLALGCGLALALLAVAGLLVYLWMAA